MNHENLIEHDIAQSIAKRKNCIIFLKNYGTNDPPLLILFTSKEVT